MNRDRHHASLITDISSNNFHWTDQSESRFLDWACVHSLPETCRTHACMITFIHPDEYIMPTTGINFDGDAVTGNNRHPAR